MGDGLKLHKGKRHKSSSSLSGVPLEGRLSTKKLDIRASIPELEDQFALAEARCDDLKEKIDLVKVLRRKRKLKKRSATRVTDNKSSNEAIPLISVRTQPKKKVSQTATRHHRYDMTPHPRGYLDPATVEQHRMIGQMHTYNQKYMPAQDTLKTTKARISGSEQIRATLKRSPVQLRPDGDASNPRKSSRIASVNISSGTQDTDYNSDVNTAEFSKPDDMMTMSNNSAMSPNKVGDRYVKVPAGRRRHVPRESIDKVETNARGYRAESSPVLRKYPNISSQKQNRAPSIPEERSVVELFNKAHYRDNDTQAEGMNSPVRSSQKKKGRRVQNQAQSDINNVSTAPMQKESHTKYPHRLKYRSRRYELPTVASQMKQARMQYYRTTANHTNIPFIVSKSTAPSHNIGVNIQQVLNGLKIQQPLSGIPLTIAHHMGLGHLPTSGHSRFSSLHMSLDNTEINAIQLGHKLVRLPSYKVNMSFNRLLSLYREGDGIVPRFLKAISRPHYFYTSMYNLATHTEDHDGATSKGHSGSQEAKQSLAEYAALYREYEYVDKCIKEGNRDPDMEQKRDHLSKELANRQDHIRRVMQEYGTTQVEADQGLRSSASTTENAYRHSTMRLNLGDPQQ